MNSTQLRDKAVRLAETDTDAALKIARGVPDPWFRAQALAAVAQWIEGHRVAAIAGEALATAESCDDDFKRAAVSAWPIRVLVERGLERPAMDAFRRARVRALAATPLGSRAEALIGLLHAAWGLGASTRRQLTEDLVALQQGGSHWRVDRAVVGAVGMLGKTDAALARGIAARISDDKCRSKALAKIEA